MRKALQVLATRSDDPAMRKQAAHVLDGDKSVGDFVTGETFNDSMMHVIRAGEEERERMSEEEFAELRESAPEIWAQVQQRLARFDPDDPHAQDPPPARDTSRRVPPRW